MKDSQKIIDSLIGSTEEEFKKICKDNNFNFRVTRDGEINYMITHDLKLDRLNIELDGGVVVKCYTG